jgi:hypothetical protein
MSEERPPIYSMTADISYTKGKNTHNVQAWIVSRYDDPLEIMLKDDHTMYRLKEESYGKNYKSKKNLTVKKIRSKTIVGHVNTIAI